MVRKHGKDENETNGSEGSGRVDWDFVETCLSLAALRMIYLHGPPGVGKTFAGYKKGRIENGVDSITLTDETPAAELRGMYMPEGDRYVWRDGPVVAAMRRGGRVVVNEIGVAGPDGLSFLLACCESRASAGMTLPNGERVVPAEGFNMVATSNESPANLPPALHDRFDCTIEIDAPHPEAMALLSEPLRRAALGTFDLAPERAVSLRSWLKLEELIQSDEMDLFLACRAVFGRERGAKIHEALTLQQLSF